jgi:hypothetical protein
MKVGFVRDHEIIEVLKKAPGANKLAADSLFGIARPWPLTSLRPGLLPIYRFFK